MKTMPLTATARTERGTRACRKLRRSGEVPVNLYGTTGKGEARKAETHLLKASAYDIVQLINKHASLLDVKFEKRKELAIVREIQRDSFGDDVLHVDLEMVAADKAIEYPVDLVLKGEAKGQKSGGRIIAQLRQLVVKAIPAKIPQTIEVRIDDLEIDQSLLVKDLKLPEGVTTAVKAESVVVQCLPPQTEEQLAAATTATPTAGAEPEVIKKVKPEEGEEGAAPAAE
jgi:large subunit ribosomal protein L25